MRPRRLSRPHRESCGASRRHAEARTPAQTYRHVVSPGETLTNLVERYGLNPNDIRHAHPEVKDLDVIHVGERLTVPFTGRYVVKRSIAKRIAEESDPSRVRGQPAGGPPRRAREGRAALQFFHPCGAPCVRNGAGAVTYLRHRRKEACFDG